MSSEETWETTVKAYMGNLCPNGNLTAAVVSVSNDYKATTTPEPEPKPEA